MLYVDIETRSRVDLRKYGVYKYAECPDFRILMAAWAHGDDPIQTAVGQEAVLAIPGLFDPDVEKCAHNAQFERVCFSRAAGEWQPPEAWRDTMALAAEYGHPLSLDRVARALRAAPKDSAGKDLIKLFCIPRRDGGWNDETTHPTEWLDFVMYCEQDVDTLRGIEHRLGDWPTEMERLTWCADQHINDFGMKIDLEMAQLAQKASLKNASEMMAESIALTGLDNPNSVQQLSRWLEEQGLALPNLQAATVEEALHGELPDDVRAVLEMRQELALAAASKYTAALETVSPDGRVRGGFRFFGAHTGRWAGRGLQPHNLPRAAFKTEVEADAAILDLKLGFPTPQSDLKKLVRPLFVGPFTVVDYSSIEARVVAWLAGEQWALQAFRDGRDIYVETAERMGGLTRAQGKVAVLALGYNGGVNSLKVMAGAGVYYGPDGKPRSYGTVGEAQADGAVEFTDDEYQEMVWAWRRENKSIVRLWALMDNAIAEGGRVGAHTRITRHGSSMKIHLPSGRAIHYHQLARRQEHAYRVKDGKRHMMYNEDGTPRMRSVWSYANPGGGRFGTYGGKLTENVTQAVARDILGEALVRLHDRGYNIAAHVHDEILVEGENSVEDVTKIMCEPPAWAGDMPIDGDGFLCARYRKG